MQIEDKLRKEIETEAKALGVQRAKLKRKLRTNRRQILQLVEESDERVSITQLAKLCKVTRQSLYNWLKV